MRAALPTVRTFFIVLNASVGLGLFAVEVLAGPDAATEKQRVLGKELFERNWLAHDIRSHDGDGLGPVFNERSCVGCHNQGGVGGGGSRSKNVEIVTPFAPQTKLEDRGAVRQLARVVKAQTGFRSLGSVVLHRSGTDPEYAAWRALLLRKTFASFSLVRSERNTPALFGAGLIDAVPDTELEALEKRRLEEFPEVHGRVSRLKGGEIGRFGWKGQTESLRDFVLTACSVELGLEVPGHPQSPDPTSKKDRAHALDLTGDECDALIAFVASLPVPVQDTPAKHQQAEMRNAGGAIFKSVGCAACHVPTVGKIEGIYSDLLLHDMGPESADSAIYYSAPIDDIPSIAKAAEGTAESVLQLGAKAEEWRTPPLWGLRDSAPYLHNGGAADLDAAIGRHGGEAARARERYRKLTGAQQMLVRKFLMSLAAPANASPVHRQSPRGEANPARPRARATSPARGSTGLTAGFALK